MSLAVGELLFELELEVERELPKEAKTPEPELRRPDVSP
jgi:hypothetical protein